MVSRAIGLVWLSLSLMTPGFAQFGGGGSGMGGSDGSVGGISGLDAGVRELRENWKLANQNLGQVPIRLVSPIGGDPRDIQLAERLGRERTELNFVDAPLNDVADFLEQVLQVNVFIDTRALEEIGESDESPVTMRSKNATVGAALRRLLRPLSCDYVVKSGVLVVTSQDVAAADRAVKVYPVADLVWWNADATDPGEADYDTLIELLQSSVAPESWASVGGEGSISVFDPSFSLVVAQSEQGHRKIHALLQQLRTARSFGPSKTGAALGELPQGRVETIVLGPSQQEEEMIGSLSANRENLKFDDTPLGDVVHFLEELAGVPIELDNQALEDLGVSADEPVSLNLKQASPLDALEFLLPALDATWLYHDDVILITSIDSGLRISRTYPVGDLLTIQSGPERWVNRGSEDQLIELITSSVEPHSWDEVGGEGAIEYFRSSQCLVVSQSREVHQSLENLLSGLRLAGHRLGAITQASGMPGVDELNAQRVQELKRLYNIKPPRLKRQRKAGKRPLR